MKRRYGASRLLLYCHHYNKYNMQGDIANNPQTLDDGNAKIDKKHFCFCHREAKMLLYSVKV